MWIGNRCYPPKDVELALESLFGESVREVKVIQYSIYVRFHWRAIATTRRNRIYLRGSGKEFFADAPLVLHEYFHVLRQWRTGDLTISRYLAECFRRGYWDNRYEVEAREYTATEIFRYRALLAQHRTASLPPNVRQIRARTG
jgi:hypothetical protein